MRINTFLWEGVFRFHQILKGARDTKRQEPLLYSQARSLLTGCNMLQENLKLPYISSPNVCELSTVGRLNFLVLWETKFSQRVSQCYWL
jgi:hypothetical protein